MKNKSARHGYDTQARDRAMVAAIFGAVANFAESSEEKLGAVVHAGKIAQAFLSGASDQTFSPACDTKLFRKNRSKVEGSPVDRAA